MGKAHQMIHLSLFRKGFDPPLLFLLAELRAPAVCTLQEGWTRTRELLVQPSQFQDEEIEGEKDEGIQLKLCSHLFAEFGELMSSIFMTISSFSKYFGIFYSYYDFEKKKTEYSHSHFINESTEIQRGSNS